MNTLKTLSITAILAILPAWAQTDQQKFDAAYFAAQPPSVQAVMKMPVGNSAELTAREQAAVAAAQKGALIDGEIVGWGFDAFQTMLKYQSYGYTWINNILQPAPLPPGLSFPGFPAYDSNNPPAGSIKVSLNLADYPPYPVPAVAPPAAPIYYIGPLIPFQINEYETWDSQPNGFTVTTSAGTFVKTRQIVDGPFGPWIVQYYSKQ